MRLPAAGLLEACEDPQLFDLELWTIASVSFWRRVEAGMRSLHRDAARSRRLRPGMSL